MRNWAVLLLLACVSFIAGCPTQPVMPAFDTGSGGDGNTVTDGSTAIDAGMDGGMDGGSTMDGGADGGATADGGNDAAASADANVDAYRPDAGPIISDPAPPATIVHTGTSGLLLRGTVLTPTGPLNPGEVLVMGNMITCVAADCSTASGADAATIIDTHATISPGLIDGHNHLTYDFIPTWVPPHLYMNRYQWRADASYSAWSRPEGDSDNNGTQDTGSSCVGAKWGELRSIIHGTTTVQGELPSAFGTCVDRLARNADGFTGLGSDIGRTTISGSCESGFPTRTSLLNSFHATAPTTRFYVHMGEGYANPGTATRTDVLREFGCFDGTDASYYTGMSLLEDPTTHLPYGTAVFIHAMPLTTAQLDRTLAQHAHIVWSPGSNLILYGQTADIAGMLSRNIPVGLGPDWTLAGSNEMLSEMRIAQHYGTDHAITALTPEQIWRMATVTGADVVGLSAIGTIAVGQRADISVFGRTSSDPYQAVIDSLAADVRLVLIDGVGYYGDVALQATTAVNTSCEAFSACGTPKYLCVANTPGAMSPTNGYTDTYSQVHAQLTSIMAAHGRTDLLELVDCSLTP